MTMEIPDAVLPFSDAGTLLSGPSRVPHQVTVQNEEDQYETHCTAVMTVRVRSHVLLIENNLFRLYYI